MFNTPDLPIASVSVGERGGGGMCDMFNTPDLPIASFIGLEFHNLM